MDQNPKKGVEESKNRSRRGDPTGVVDFQRYHCLSASVCSVDTGGKNRLLALKRT